MDQTPHRSKPVAELQWKATKGLQYGVRAEGLPVWLRCREHARMRYSVIKALWHPGDQFDQSDSQLILICPACGDINTQIRIAGTKVAIAPSPGKTFQWELLQRPIKLQLPDRPEPVCNTLRLSIVESMECPHCHQGFRLTDNTLHLT